MVAPCRLICDDETRPFPFTVGDGYARVGSVSADGAGYVKEVAFGPGGEIVAKTLGGGSSTHHCDRSILRPPSAGEAFFAATLGGAAADAQDAGLTAASFLPADFKAKNVGTRLCFLP